MMKREQAPVNKLLLAVILTLAIGGFIMFLSASVGLATRDSGAKFHDIIFSQSVFGLLPGLIGMYFISRVPYSFFKSWSFYIFISSVILTSLVFIPGLGFEHGGAQRWLSIGGQTVQPSEFLKIGVLIYLSAWFSLAYKKQESDTFMSGTLPFVIVTAIAGIILLLQPDVDTFLVIFVSALSIYIIAGIKPKHFIGLFAALVCVVALLAMTFPYIQSRIQTFIDPQRDSLGASYQIQQSLIAVGSGGLTGKGFGKSIQKFNYLPEPVGDSVFAVASEEFGFAGSSLILLLFFLFGHFGLRVAKYAADPFGRFLAVGIVVMILTQAFINIGAMIGILPLSGITLPFVSHGGTALLFTLLISGLLLSISRNAQTK